MVKNTFSEVSADTPTTGEVDGVGRRTVIRAIAMSGCCLAASGLISASPASAQAKKVKPEPGQRFAHMTGDKEGQLVVPDDVKLGKPLLAYPMDATTTQVHGSRANLLILMRLNETDLEETMKPHAASGIVAYSGICTHEGCPISGEHENPRMALCNCHGSTFDLGANGKVIAGPATRRLAMLPVAITDGTLVVAGKLNGPIGPPA
jgi:rieske iron-sulfur protein